MGIYIWCNIANGTIGANAGASETSSGFFGLGAALGQSALFKNLNASTLTGTNIYSSALNDSSFLQDFFMGTNPINASVDGSKRDRIAYTGDLDVSVGLTLASTFGTEYILGTFDLFAGYQATPWKHHSGQGLVTSNCAYVGLGRFANPSREWSVQHIKP